MTTQADLLAWLNGTVDGGPNGDGKYPLIDKQGVTHLVLCPAAQAATDAEDISIPDMFRIAAEEARDAALASQNAAAASATAAANSALAASGSEANAALSMQFASESEGNAQVARDDAEASATAAAGSATAAAGSATTASTANTNAQAAKTAAETARDLAQQWASNAEDVVVTGGQYSARHWAAKAAASALSVNAANLVTIAGIQEITGAKTFAGGAITVKGDTTARVYLRDGTGVAQGMLWWDAASDGVYLRRYAADGSAAEGQLGLFATGLEWNGKRIWDQGLTDNATTLETAFTVKRFGSQYLAIYSDGGGTILKGLSDVANGKPMLFDSTTDAANTVPTAGGNGYYFRVRGADAFRINDNRRGTFYNGVDVTGAISATLGAYVGADSDIYLYEGTANQFNIRVGPSTAYKYFGFNVDGSLSISNGGLTVAGNIRGDWSGAPAVRPYLQSYTTNGITNIGVLPNGTATTAIVAVGNNSDINNGGFLQLRMDATLAVLNSANTGTGVLRPISFQFNSAEAVAIDVPAGGTSKLKVSATAEAQLELNCTAAAPGRNIRLVSNNNGNTGFYDVTNAKWALQIDSNNSIHLGAVTRQMINLWNTNYGIGVQNNTAYIRTGGGRFSIFQAGVHSDTENDPGTGGSRLLFMNTSHGMFLYNGWFRSQQLNTGWYHEAGAGGWFMSDTSWVRNYNNKPICITNNSGGTVARWESPSPTFEFYDTDEGTTSWLHLNGGSHGFLQHNSFAWSNYRDSSNNWICVSNIAAYASDARLKTNAQLVRDFVIDRFFDGIEIEEYDWDAAAIAVLNPGFVPTAWHEVGARAQKVELVFKGMVHTRGSVILDGQEHEGIKTLLWEKAVPFTVAGVQRLRAENVALKQRVTTLEEQMATVLARLAQLENAA